MKYMNMINKYYNVAGEYGGDGGGSGGDADAGGADDKATYTKADVDALVAKAVAEQVQGLFQFAHSEGVQNSVSK